MSLDILNAANAAPAAAKYIGVYNSVGTLVGKIPLDNLEKTNRGNELYRIGLISDIHVDSGDFNYSGGSSTTYWIGDEAQADLARALTYFKDNLNCDFVCSAGDIGLASATEELTTWQSILNTNAADLPVYTCTGNHDVYSSSYYGRSEFNTYTRRDVETSAHALTNSTAYQNSFYFDHTSTGANGNVITDHYIFFSMYQNTPGSSGSPYLDDDITWLSNLLASFSTSDRVFIFTHYYFEAYAGNLGYANSNGMYGKEKGLAGTQETTLVNLLKQYPNTIWFSGHTHWSWQMQQYEEKANVKQDSNGGWTVHLSSLAVPIDCTTYAVDNSTTGSSTNQYGRRAGSQAAYAIIYENGVQIECIDFNTQAHLNDDGTCQGDTSTDNTAIIPYACYWLSSNAAGNQSAEDAGIDDSYAVSLTWTTGSKISSSTGEASTSTDRSITDFIPVTAGNYYYLSASNLMASDSSDTTGGINSIAMYAYDADQAYLGRVPGYGKDYSETYSTWYFDLAGGTDSDTNATATSFTDFNVTDYIFDNDGTASDETASYTGTIAYIRISIVAASGTSSTTHEGEVVLKEVSGSSGGEVITTYGITNNLTNCTSSNSATKVQENESYEATISYDSTSYPNLSITVTMGGTDITSTAVSGATISIAQVTGHVIVTAKATADAPTFTAATVKPYSDLSSMSTGDSKTIVLLNPSTTGYILKHDGTSVGGDPDSFSSMTGGTSISTTDAASNLSTITTYVNNTCLTDSEYWFTLTKTSGGWTIASYNGAKEFYSSSSSNSQITWGTSGDWTLADGSSNAGSSNLVYGNANQIWIKNANGLYLRSSYSSTYTDGSALSVYTSTGGWTMWLIYELT